MTRHPGLMWSQCKTHFESCVLDTWVGLGGSGDTLEDLGLWAVDWGGMFLSVGLPPVLCSGISQANSSSLCAPHDSERVALAKAQDVHRASGQGRVGLDSPHFTSGLYRVDVYMQKVTGLSRQQEEISVFIMQFICSVLTIYFRMRWITVDSIDCIDWLSID